jgi:diguanylate cyclase (GGDEF)-like protein/PAS domain S-box-containing protein
MTSALRTWQSTAATPITLPDSVLVVDDSPSDRRLLAEMLVEAGVDRAGIGQAATLHGARQLLTTATFDCILLDLSLPDASGLEGVSILAIAAPTTPIVVVTGHPADDLVFAAIAEGAEEFICKTDLQVDDLRHAVQRARGRRNRSRERVLSHHQDSSEFDALDAATAKLDGSGVIRSVNRAWLAALEHVGADASRASVGVNYLRVCDLAAGPWSEGATEVAAGIRSVLSGAAEHFTFDYPCPDRGQERWFTVRVTPLGEAGGGAIVSHLDITAFKRAEAEVRAGESKVRSALDEAGPFVAVIATDGSLSHVSAMVERTFGMAAGEDVGVAMRRVLLPTRIPDLAKTFVQVRDEPGSSDVVLVRARDTDGRWRDLEVSLTNLYDDPLVQGLVVTCADVTEGRREQVVRHLEGSLLRGLPTAVVVTDDDGIVLLWNKRAEALFGLPADLATGRHFVDLDIGTPPPVHAAIIESIRANGRWEGEHDARRGDGSTVPIHFVVETIEDEGIGFAGAVAAAVDVSERRRLEQELAFQALHDPLTNLPNRRLFVDHLEGALARAERHGHAVAVLYIDLDDFKLLNDSAGHATGDEVLRTIGDLVYGLIRDGDVAARFGGDEFVLCCEVAGGDDAVRIALRLLESLRFPFRSDGKLHQVTASVGIALSQPDSHAEVLLRQADAAMYAAKESGKGRMQLFDADLHRKVRERLDLANELRAAIQHGELETYFQPEVELRNGRLHGFEALVRWNHPVRGLVGPDAFIPLAEESGYIADLGEQVLRAACAAAAKWRSLRPGDPPMVAVNVSVRQLADPAFAALVAAIVADAGIDAGNLCLEVTESSMMEVGDAEEALIALRATGVRMAIDDFGTGYSSLNRLKRFPVDFLKVDKSFVDGLGKDTDDDAIVATVLNLASTLGIKVVAEGVETEEQRELLLYLGCEVGQGYLWSPAVPFSETLPFMASDGVRLGR